MQIEDLVQGLQELEDARSKAIAEAIAAAKVPEVVEPPRKKKDIADESAIQVMETTVNGVTKSPGTTGMAYAHAKEELITIFWSCVQDPDLNIMAYDHIQSGREVSSPVRHGPPEIWTIVSSAKLSAFAKDFLQRHIRVLKWDLWRQNYRLEYWWLRGDSCFLMAFSA